MRRAQTSKYHQPDGELPVYGSWQGICSSQDLFNYVTDGETKVDEDFDVLKNIDDFCIYPETLAGQKNK